MQSFTLPASLVRLHAQILKELLSVLRDPRSRFVLIVPPLLQLFVFSFAATLEVRHVELAVLDRDGGRAAVELVQQLRASSLVQGLRMARSEAEVAELIERQDVLAALLIPADFTRRALAVAGGGLGAGAEGSGHGASAQLLLDGRRANAAQITLAYLQQIAAQSGVTLAQRASPELVSVRHWFNPNLIYRWFVLPGLAGVLVTFISLLVTALSIARERELGTFDQLLVSPCTPGEIIVAKTVPAFLVASALALAMMGVGVFGFGLPFTGSLGLLVLCLLLFILANVGVGLMISSVCSTQQQAILGTFAVAVPAVLMSGFATPVQNMPQLLQWAAEALPLKHFLIVLHGSFLKGMTRAEVMAHVWPLLLIAAVTLSVATRLVRSKLA